jgi:hypothetical protein
VKKEEAAPTKPTPQKAPKAPAAPITVRFLQRDAPWNQGDSQAFAPAVAERLIASGAACLPADYEATLKARRDAALAAQRKGRDGR